jgi:hypothetical protein
MPTSHEFCLIDLSSSETQIIEVTERMLTTLRVSPNPMGSAVSTQAPRALRRQAEFQPFFYNPGAALPLPVEPERPASTFGSKLKTFATLALGALGLYFAYKFVSNRLAGHGKQEKEITP